MSIITYIVFVAAYILSCAIWYRLGRENAELDAILERAKARSRK